MEEKMKKISLLFGVVTSIILCITFSFSSKNNQVFANTLTNSSQPQAIDLELKAQIVFLRTLIFQIPNDNRDKVITTERGNTIHTNLVYPSSYNNNTFDLYVPKNKLKDSPTIIWVHGGAFIGGGKADPSIQNYLDELASNGYTIASIDYELAPEATYPSQLIQISEFVSYLKTANLGINLDNLFMAGDSAGGQLAAQFSLTQTNPNYRESLNIEQVLNESSIKGNLLYCGFYDLNSTALTNDASFKIIWKYVGWALSGTKNWYNSPSIKSMTIKDYVTEKFPPSYITDGNANSFTEQGEALVHTLKELGVKTDSFFCPEDEYGTQGHEFQFDLSTSAAQKALEDSKLFLAEHRN